MLNKPVKNGDHVFLVDGSGYIFRAFHALPALTRKSDGLPIGAVAGFCNMLWTLMRDMQGDAPTHLAVIWDHSEKTFRNKLYDQYKAHRPPPPEDLIPQFPLVRDATRAEGRRTLGLDPTGTCVLVAGGSQGAQSINEAALGAFCPNPPFDVVHVAGERNEAAVRAHVDSAGCGPRYHVFGFLSDFPAALAAADLVISRSGGSVFELAAIGRPSILVPYPHATADHQTGNAQWLADAGAAIVLRDDECTADRLKEIVGALLIDRHRLEAMGEAARHAARPDAAERIADMVEAAARR